ncbi:hypothetical protein FOIG_05826 [Fusarium odoratissimum NRRL 54006]|uniref:Uncharacterized protein n=1 Tax=Fusarium odoratissimum (strain NRRL 54006) TaxID=1089451 RepID=X0K2K1_FUSO5|nr:uncharacterized protein FOIG_05826 [Fusarium odoratissimum NRRL 54006]EXM02841.1 hypothetical protein FOIG_05826 [Fusarium odoratissimum NRRL 54006]
MAKSTEILRQSLILIYENPQTVEQQTRELHKLPEAGNTVDTIV